MSKSGDKNIKVVIITLFQIFKKLVEEMGDIKET